MKQREFTAIFKSGLVGAFAFVGISFVLSMAFGFLFRWMAWLLYLFFLSVAFPKTVFIVMGSVGFILGLLSRRRFPVIQSGPLPMIIASALLIIALGWRGLLVHKMWQNTELPPGNLKLSECTNDAINVHLKIPAGHDYQLGLQIPESQASADGNSNSNYVFSGSLRIFSNEVLLARIPISSDKEERNGSWYALTGAGLQHTNLPPLSKFVQPNKDYEFIFSFEPAPPTNASIWLYYLRSFKDLN